MSQALWIGSDHAENAEWFACDRCGARQRITTYVWRSVPAIGEKPTLNACEHAPHIPPSPRALALHR